MTLNDLFRAMIKTCDWYRGPGAEVSCGDAESHCRGWTSVLLLPTQNTNGDPMLLSSDQRHLLAPTTRPSTRAAHQLSASILDRNVGYVVDDRWIDVRHRSPVG
jgi:hypothetical protein